jgi:hypothetical protein
VEGTWHGIAWSTLETGLRIIRTISHDKFSNSNLLRLARHCSDGHSHDHRFGKKRLPFSPRRRHFGRAVLLVLGRISDHSIPNFLIALAAIFLCISHVSQAGDVRLGVRGPLFFNDLVVDQCARRRLSLFAFTNCE